MLYSVFVGRYKTIPESKKDQKKLNTLDFRGYVFFRGNYYSLKVATYPNKDKAETLKNFLIKNGFEAYVA